MATMAPKGRLYLGGVDISDTVISYTISRDEDGTVRLGLVVPDGAVEVKEREA